MNGLVHKFNAKVPWPLRLLLVVGVGLCLREVVLFLVFDGLAVARKLTGQATICPWPRVASYYFDLLDRSKRIRAYSQSASVLDVDEDLGLMLISYPSKSFWCKPLPGDDGSGGLADLLAEQDWVAHKNPNPTPYDSPANLQQRSGPGSWAGSAPVGILDKSVQYW